MDNDRTVSHSGQPSPSEYAPAWRVTFYTSGGQVGTCLTDKDLADVRDAVIGYWNGSGAGGLVLGSLDNSTPVLVNLDRVEFVRCEQIDRSAVGMNASGQQCVLVRR